MPRTCHAPRASTRNNKESTQRGRRRPSEERMARGEQDDIDSTIRWRAEWRRADRSIAYGTYAYTCPRSPTMGLARSVPPLVCEGGRGYHPVGASSRAPNERRTSRGAGVAQSRALARAIIIHSNDDECLYPSGPAARLGELMTRATHGMPRSSDVGQIVNRIVITHP